MTQGRALMSTPRARRSVATRMRSLPVLKSWSRSVRVPWLSFPWMESAWILLRRSLSAMWSAW